MWLRIFTLKSSCPGELKGENGIGAGTIIEA